MFSCVRLTLFNLLNTYRQITQLFDGKTRKIREVRTVNIFINHSSFVPFVVSYGLLQVIGQLRQTKHSPSFCDVFLGRRHPRWPVCISNGTYDSKVISCIRYLGIRNNIVKEFPCLNQHIISFNNPAVKVNQENALKY